MAGRYPSDQPKAQFDLAMKVYKQLEHMTFAVESIEGVRDAANARAAKLPEKDPLRKQLQQLATDCDTLRSKIVATKEGGMITGEERIREHIGQLYGAINSYDGKPTDYQVARTESLAHELQDVIDDFQKQTQKSLPAINSGLKKKKLEPISVLFANSAPVHDSASGVIKSFDQLEQFAAPLIIRRKERRDSEG